MELSKIYTDYSGWECLIGFVGFIALVTGIVLLAHWLIESDLNKRNGIIASILLVVGALCFVINTYIPNQVIYKYHVNNMKALEQKVNEGYVIVDSEGTIYSIKKGE